MASNPNFEKEMHALCREATALYKKFSAITDLSRITPAEWLATCARTKLFGNDRILDQCKSEEIKLAEYAIANGHGTLDAAAKAMREERLSR